MPAPRGSSRLVNFDPAAYPSKPPPLHKRPLGAARRHPVMEFPSISSMHPNYSPLKTHRRELAQVHVFKGSESPLENSRQGSYRAIGAPRRASLGILSATSHFYPRGSALLEMVWSLASLS